MNSRGLLVLHLSNQALELNRVRNTLHQSHLSHCFALESHKSFSRFSDRLRKKPLPDVILLDLDYKEASVDGILITQECRSLFQQTVIIAYSGFDNTKMLLQSLNFGANDYLSKHTAIETLPERIIHICHSVAHSTLAQDHSSVGCCKNSLARKLKYIYNANLLSNQDINHWAKGFTN